MPAWLDALLAVLLAPVCAACERPLDTPTRGTVCRHCWESIRPLTPPLCIQCGDPLATWRARQERCPRCRRTASALTSSRAIGAYEGALRTIVHALKYDGRRSLAPPLAALMCARGRDVLAGASAVIPVPLHRARRWQRGFNQADDLAASLPLPLVTALVRVRSTATQTTLPAARRHANVRGAFAVTAAGRSLAGRTVVLVDDVATTGATLEACARTLKEAGVLEVRGLTAARVVTVRP